MLGEGIVREFGMDMYTLLYLKWITNKDLLYSTWNSAQCYIVAWMGGSLGENGFMHMYDCSPETVITLLISYTWLQIKSLKKRKLKSADNNHRKGAMGSCKKKRREIIRTKNHNLGHKDT